MTDSLEPIQGATDRELEDGSTDALVREEPLVLEVAGQTVITMRTPGNDQALATGFLLSEGVIDNAAVIEGALMYRPDLIDQAGLSDELFQLVSRYTTPRDPGEE